MNVRSTNRCRLAPASASPCSRAGDRGAAAPRRLGMTSGDGATAVAAAEVEAAAVAAGAAGVVGCVEEGVR